MTNCSARRALRALTAIVDGSIDQIETTLDTSGEHSHISCVLVLVEVTEVGAHTDGRNGNPIDCVSVELRGKARRESRGKTLGACGSGVTLDRMAGGIKVQRSRF